MVRKLFVEWPFCAATYAGLAIALALLFFRYDPPKPDIPRFLVDDPAMEGAQYAIKVGGTPYFVAYTGSMKPYLQGGEIVVCKSDFEGIKLGDVVVYRASFSYTPIIHRAVQKDKAGWIMSGDANRDSESWARVRKDNYLGTVVAIFVRK